MAKPRRGPSFSDTVDAVKAASMAESPRSIEPGIQPDGKVVAPGGRSYEMAASDISSAVALAAASSGALVAWDSCGCGGGCELTWFNDDDVAHMATAGRPLIRRTKKAYGSISEYRSGDGRVLLLVEETVRWGPFFA